jgi:signal transduction histidine kinase
MNAESAHPPGLDSLYLIQQAITNRLDESDVLQLIANEARKVSNAHRCAVFLVEGDQLCIAATSGEAAPSNVGTTIPLAGSLVEQAITSGELSHIDDAPTNPHVLAHPARKALIEKMGIQSLLIAPLMVEGQAIGGISLSDKIEGQFDDADEQVLSLMAVQAALAVENARLRRQVQQAAIREERSRLARELHDSVTQSLYSLTLFAEAARGLAEGANDTQLENRLARIGEIAQQALKEMRLLVYELRPQELSAGGLIGAIRQRLEAVEGRAGIETALRVEGPLTLPNAIEQELYRVAQEALNNALKHARATALTVTLQRGGNAVMLEIQDDGVGFDPSAVDDSGMGLHSMRERVEKLGGIMTIDSAAGEGTRVRVTIGLEDEG